MLLEQKGSWCVFVSVLNHCVVVLCNGAVGTL